jgi:ribosomal protein L23
MSTLKFDEGRLMQVLVAPIVSEKATMVAEKSNAVTFKVLQNATKPEIKAAVELMFKVEVKGVSVVNTKGKTKRFGKTVGRRDNVRKAYVTLQARSRAEPVRGGCVIMAVVKMKPTSPGQRAVVKVTRDHLYKGEAYAPLLEPQFQKAGRNNNGHITTRHKGGGHKHHYRVVDFKRNKDGIPAKVERIEYDPTVRPTSLWCAMPTASVATSSLRVVWKWRNADERFGSPDPRWQHAADPQHPRGFDHPLHRAQARCRCADRPLGRCFGNAAGP